jgi:hypothetical protein
VFLPSGRDKKIYGFVDDNTADLSGGGSAAIVAEA